MGAGCTSRTPNVIDSTLSKKAKVPSASPIPTPAKQTDQPNPTPSAVVARNNNKNIKSLLDKAMEEDSQELGGNVLSQSVNLDRLHHKIESELLKKNRDALFEAVEMNDTAAMERILQEENQFEEAALYSNEGQSLLHRAALLGHIDALMLLIARTNARPDLLNYNLSTPLHVACRHNQEAIVRFLVGCGVDVNLQDQNGQTALLVSCIHGNHGVMEFLVEASNSGHTSEVLEVERSDN